ncbi:MAG: hypothetical protein R3D55_09640 [Chloroflexota bacterium]
MQNDRSEPALTENVKQKSRLIQTENGFAYRDLNKNGKLDIYEDPRQPIEARVADLLSQMTLAEKAGMLFIDGVRVNPDGSIEEKDDDQAFTGFGNPVKSKLIDLKMNHFNIWQIPGARPGHLVQQRPAAGRREPPGHSHHACLRPAQSFGQKCHLYGRGRFFTMVRDHRLWCHQRP